MPSYSRKDLAPLLENFTTISYVSGWWGVFGVVANGEKYWIFNCGDLKEDELKELVEAFRTEVGMSTDVARDLNVERSKEAVPAQTSETKAAERLYDCLIAPAVPFIRHDLLCIVSDDILNYVPFEALRHKGRYLVEDYAVFYAPSMGVLKWCMDREQLERKSVLAIGNPNLRNPAFRLVHAENEAQSLAARFAESKALTIDSATESAVKELAGGFDVLHFACHGELNLDNPMLTSLRLAPDGANDGYLHAGEVFDFPLTASLVVLSACNSGLGELSSGNELMGLTRSFLCSGAPSVLSSLWVVDDRSTALLMDTFYENLEHMNKADALREAKLAVMKDFPKPFNWAAFCLQGDYR